MRVSRLMLVTLRDIPADAEIISHQLLLRGGYIKRVTAGVYAYMPLMWKVIQKITNIVREELNNAGCLETLLPQLHPSDLWKESGRWEGYTAGEGIMFHLKDRQGRELGLGPTHEEVITKIIGEVLNSYKQLPVNLYQIQTKFRDEIRPRFGLMRGREFIMKDAYSFHKNKACLVQSYEKMNDAYEKIFKRCGLHTVKVDADSGAIGGAASQEFMVTANSGEDLILISEDGTYSANQEKAISIPEKAVPLKNGTPTTKETKEQCSIETLCVNNNLHASQIIKVVLFLSILEGGEEIPILVSTRGDQEINEVKLINEISKEKKKAVLNISQITSDKLISQGLNCIPFGYIGPDLSDSFLNNASTWERKFTRFTDHTAANLNHFVCGANKIDLHHFYFNWELLGKLKHKTVDIRKARAGEHSISKSKSNLIEKRGIEVGHIFQLGRKYSEALDSKFTNESGLKEAFWMGCYGIGISRLAQAAIEQSNDKNGIIWPLSIAPFEVVIIIANLKDNFQKDLGEKLYSYLKNKNIDVLLDDREERAGVKFKDADLIGIPIRITVGRNASEDKVELKKRSDIEALVLSSEEVLKRTFEEVSSQKQVLSN